MKRLRLSHQVYDDGKDVGLTFEVGASILVGGKNKRQISPVHVKILRDDGA